MKIIRRALLAWALLAAAVLAGAAPPGADAPRRIISMAPAATEILFALGLGDRVVGVTRYCDYPAEAVSIAKVGGYVDPSYEAMVALRPDLTALLTSHRDAKSELDKMNLRTIVVPHDTVGDIHEAIRLIGEACGKKKQAEALLSELTSRTLAVEKAVEGKKRPRVLMCIGRDTESGQLAAMYVAGRAGFYDEVIAMAGGVNAAPDEKAAYPQISAEGVMKVNPDVIIDLVGFIRPGKRTPADIVRQWGQLRTVPAVRNGQVHVIVGTEALRPGPRYVVFLEKLGRLLHPEAFAKSGGHE